MSAGHGGKCALPAERRPGGAGAPSRRTVQALPRVATAPFTLRGRVPQRKKKNTIVAWKMRQRGGRRD